MSDKVYVLLSAEIDGFGTGSKIPVSIGKNTHFSGKFSQIG